MIKWKKVNESDESNDSAVWVCDDISMALGKVGNGKYDVKVSDSGTELYVIDKTTKENFVVTVTLKK